MILRNLTIKNFRGIKSLDWHVPSKFICLIGPCDSSKSTILKAIEYALYPTWGLNISDTDFYNQNIDETIEIIATIGEIPSSLITENKFGHYLRGWNKQSGLVDEPLEGYHAVLSIKLEVDKTLEPKWTVINNRIPEGVVISASDREALGASFLGIYADRDLSWSKGSSLLRLTGQLEDAGNVLSSARRTIRQDVARNIAASWNDVCDNVENVAKQYGLAPRNDLNPGFDIRGNIHATGHLALHDGDVPARMYGLGSRRILSLSIQQQSTINGAILLIDEIEIGLEPFRLRHLIRALRQSTKEVDSLEEGTHNAGQAIITTHSSVTLVECHADELFVTQASNGEIKIKQVNIALQNVVRSSPEALLSKKVIVSEGKTEIGVSRGLDIHWSSIGNMPFAHLGITTALGEGSNSAKRAISIQKLGYEVLLLIDSDVEPAEIADARALNIPIIEWEDSFSVEQRIFNDVTWEQVKKITRLGLENVVDMNAELNAIASKLASPQSPITLTPNLDDWLNTYNEVRIRQALGDVSKNRGWFKRVDFGETLGIYLAQELDNIPDSPLKTKINQVKNWCYGNYSPSSPAC